MECPSSYGGVCVCTTYVGYAESQGNGKSVCFLCCWNIISIEVSRDVAAVVVVVSSTTSFFYFCFQRGGNPRLTKLIHASSLLLAPH